jgi:hypothetical protein
MNKSIADFRAFDRLLNLLMLTLSRLQPFPGLPHFRKSMA